MVQTKSTLSSRLRPLALLSALVVPLSCTSDQALDKGAVGVQPVAETQPPQHSVSVGSDGVRVEVSGCSAQARSCGVPLANVMVKLVLPSGDEVTGKTGTDGVALLRPTLDMLVHNAEAGTARVVVAGASRTVNMSALLEATRSANADAWSEREQALSALRSRADGAIRFNANIFRDPPAGPFVEQCSPSGPEQCLDGIDNDCDGRYDNLGCGYSSGVLQWTVTWTGPADLDLHVVGPSGEEVSPDRPLDTTSRLHLDRACDGTTTGCPGGNLENVVVPAEQTPLSGTYHARVEVREAPATDEPIRGRISGRIGSHTWFTEFALAPFPGVAYRVAFPVGADADNDNVVDEHDACPSEPGCWFDDVAYRGCPDMDSDSVPDAIDACPDKAGINRKGAMGCPIEFGNAWVTNHGIKILSRMEFDFGKATLRPESQQLVADVARAMLARPEGAEKISINGHTDNVGDVTTNIGLSRRRANAVREALIERGVDGQLLQVRGYGETRPIASNDTEEGRQVNRRVEFVVLRPPPHTTQCW